MITEDVIKTAFAARQLLRAHRYGALGTLSQKYDGHPYGSIVPYLVDHDGSVLILISSLAEHTRNILHDPRVSLLTHNPESTNIQAQGRVSLLGMAHPEDAPEQVGKRYLRYFPEARQYYDMADFRFFRITPLALRFIGGFGDIHWIIAEHYQVPAGSFALEEEALLAELNASRPAARGKLIGIDCDGYDLYLDGRIFRHHFPAPVTDSAEVMALIHP